MKGRKMTRNDQAELVAYFQSETELSIYAEGEEMIFIQLDSENRQTDAWYRRFKLDPEWNAQCEQLIDDLFENGEHVWKAIQKFNARPDIASPVIDQAKVFLGNTKSPLVTSEQFAKEEAPC